MTTELLSKPSTSSLESSIDSTNSACNSSTSVDSKHTSVADSDSEPTLKPVSVLKPIVVFSQRTPVADKEKIQDWLLTELKKYPTPEGARIMPIIPELKKESAFSTAYEWLENEISRDERFCFLCVVNNEFKEDWDYGLSSSSSREHSLVYAFQSSVLGMHRCRIHACQHVMVIHWTDTVPTPLVPHGLRECQTAQVNDTEKIACFVFKAPAEQLLIE